MIRVNSISHNLQFHITWIQ